MQVPLIALSVILAVVFAATAVPKLLGKMDDRMSHLGVSTGLTKVIGALELAGVVGLVLGLYWAPAGIAAAVGLTILMIGAVTYHLRAKDPGNVVALPVAFAAASAAVALLHVLNG
ncbi:DoxX family protein [Micromonospora olivasterospora]|uniref:DoxX-like protein n=1 Tax=Micromonospora olivasterospora TaxID=1880 RepID=A0A562IEG3_MICOL|nr:DoxX family protein [Micromonospora olivasterospora]TWH69198.1 DoxX-like protein [Micromonospora olivasterospora]